MAWTTEDRRRYAPAIQEMVRQGMLVRLATTIDAIVATCCDAWNWLAAAPDRLASITRREWARAVTN